MTFFTVRRPSRGATTGTQFNVFVTVTVGLVAATVSVGDGVMTVVQAGVTDGPQAVVEG